jgi:hypothetical protein
MTLTRKRGPNGVLVPTAKQLARPSDAKVGEDKVPGFAAFSGFVFTISRMRDRSRSGFVFALSLSAQTVPFADCPRLRCGLLECTETAEIRISIFGNPLICVSYLASFRQIRCLGVNHPSRHFDRWRRTFQYFTNACACLQERSHHCCRRIDRRMLRAPEVSAHPQPAGLEAGAGIDITMKEPVAVAISLPAASRTFDSRNTICRPCRTTSVSARTVPLRTEAR